ncbi:MAG: hypothetical protein LAO56_10560 [Acidobacteriia bacterium]|nr:hypothetical protein [Terriglobia bacterium]
MKEIFATRNVDDCELHVGLTERSIFNGVPQIAAAKLADVVDGARCNGNWEIDDEQLYASDRLSDFVSYVHGLSIPSLGLHVHVTLTGWPGRDGAWIDEAITKKAKRYPDRTVAQTALVIGAAWSIDSEHVQSYLASERCATIPFSEAWIVLFGGRAIPLKLRR